MARSFLSAAAILVLVMLSPALAQSNAPSGTTTQAPAIAPPGMQGGTTYGAFIEQQDKTQWRASQLIGTKVNGPDDTRIGNISDILIDSSGNARAAVVAVGDFLGAAEKNVAMPYTALTFSRATSGDKVEKATVAYRKEDLQNAPSFKWAEADALSNERRTEIQPVR